MFLVVREQVYWKQMGCQDDDIYHLISAKKSPGIPLPELVRTVILNNLVRI